MRQYSYIQRYRELLIRAVSKAGFSGSDIAKLFKTSKQNVSYVLKKKLKVKISIVENGK